MALEDTRPTVACAPREGASRRGHAFSVDDAEGLVARLAAGVRAILIVFDAKPCWLSGPSWMRSTLYGSSMLWVDPRLSCLRLPCLGLSSLHQQTGVRIMARAQASTASAVGRARERSAWSLSESMRVSRAEAYLLECRKLGRRRDDWVRPLKRPSSKSHSTASVQKSTIVSSLKCALRSVER